MAWKIRERRPRSRALSCSVSYAGMSRIRFDGFAFASQPLRTPQRNWHRRNKARIRMQASVCQMKQGVRRLLCVGRMQSHVVCCCPARRSGPARRKLFWPPAPDRLTKTQSWWALFCRPSGARCAGRGGGAANHTVAAELPATSGRLGVAAEVIERALTGRIMIISVGEVRDCRTPLPFIPGTPFFPGAVRRHG